jgi:hypothetical protein
MTNQHPITPPPELVQEWRTEPEYASANQLLTMVSMTQNRLMELCQKSAQYGADQELEACCHYFARDLRESLALELRAARRPKPPSLKEQAYAALDTYIYGNPDHGDKQNTYNTIRRALEALPE